MYSYNRIFGLEKGIEGPSSETISLPYFKEGAVDVHWLNKHRTVRILTRETEENRKFMQVNTHDVFEE
jgi:hypothetical protein